MAWYPLDCDDAWGVEDLLPQVSDFGTVAEQLLAK